ncbi:MAG: insulinase family protein [Clostridiales bacterium]|nr:insulinase family protein [Clostridiales bacterium]
MVTTKILPNGVKVVVKKMEGLLSVTMGILVGTGAAYEKDEEDGISHFIEHMQFKGTETRTAFEISDAFDALGAQVNAFTGKDLTCYYVKATSDHARESFGLLADLFLNSTFPEDEMAREKGVVVEEINMDEDSPEDLCLDLLARATYGSENYGRNILGPASNVMGFTREDLFRYKKERYCPENIVVSFAGNLDEHEAVELAEEFLGGMQKTAFENRKKNVRYQHGNLFKKKQIEQAHFALSFPAIERDHPDYAATQVMNVILGGGMSSRLFKRVREELGLAYSVYSYLTHYEEAGSLSVYAGVNASKAEDAAAAVVDVLKKFQSEGVTEEEFLRGREQLKSSTIFSQENTSSQMLLYGKNMLYTGKIYDFEARMAEIAELKIGDITRVIEKNFDFSRVAVASVGNLKKGVEIG